MVNLLKRAIVALFLDDDWFWVIFIWAFVVLNFMSGVPAWVLVIAWGVFAMLMIREMIKLGRGVWYEWNNWRKK